MKEYHLLEIGVRRRFEKEIPKALPKPLPNIWFVGLDLCEIYLKE